MKIEYFIIKENIGVRDLNWIVFTNVKKLTVNLGKSEKQKGCKIKSITST